MNSDTGRSREDESDAIVFKGATLNQLARIFGVEVETIKKKIADTVRPCGSRAGHAVYAIKDVASVLVKPAYDIDEFIAKMTVADLPMFIHKEFWAGMRNRQEYQLREGELWPTSKVIETVSTLLKELRLSLLQTREAVERQTELTDQQRSIITRIIDNALKDAHATSSRQFTAIKAANADSGEAQDEEL